MYLIKYANYLILFFWIQNVNLILTQTSKPRIDKSYELFKYSPLVEYSKQRNSFKLKCDFSNTKGSSSSSEDSAKANQEDEVNLKSKIKWYKLDGSNANKQYAYKSDDLREKFQAFISDEQQLENSSRLITNLEFKYNNQNDISMMSGNYICKLANSTTQFMQQISINEFVSSDEAVFKLNYSVIQTTNTRVILEIYSISYNNEFKNQQSNVSYNYKLLYTMINSNTENPVLKGEFDMLWPTISQQVYSNRFLFQQMQPVFIIFEGLNSNSNYTLLIHLKKTPISTSKHNLNQISQVQLVLNRTVSTLSSTKDADTKSHKANNEVDYYDDEDEYYLEDQSEEDYTEISSSSSSYSELNKRNEKIVSCDLSRTSVSTPSEMSADASSGSSPNSLFNLNSNKRKIKNQFITINYSSNSMNKLVLSVLNTSANLTDFQSLNKQQQLVLNEISSNVSNFKDFFDVKQFGKDSFDYSVYYDCLKQYNVNSKQINFILTRPLCLFSLAPTWQSLSDDEVARNEDFFSVQTTITVPSSKIDLIRLKAQGNSLDSKQHAFIIASSCHKKRYTNRNIQSLMSDDAIQIFPSKKVQSKHQSFKKQDLDSNKNSSSQFSNLVLNEGPANQNKTVEMLPFILSTTTLSSLISSIKQQIKKQSSLISDTLSINDCLFISDNELQFRIDHDLIGNSSGSKHVKAMPISNKSTYAYPIIYEIEVTLPVNAKNVKTSQRTVLNHQPSYVNFNLKKENNSQVVRVNLTNIYTTNNQKLLIEEDEVYYSDESNKDDDSVSTNKFQANSNNKQSKFSSLKEDLKLTRASKKQQQQPNTKQSANSVSSDYIFKVRILSQDKTLSTEVINVKCEKMTSPIDTNNSFVGLIMTSVCALIIVIVGFLFCLIMKKKYGLTPDYFLNLKANNIFKSSNMNGKRSKNIYHHDHQQQYQLQQSSDSHTNTSSNSNNAKNPTFNYNYEDNDAIGVDLFEAYVQQMHIDGDFGFAQLYEEITGITKMYSYSSDISLLDCNRCKNRYSNILTYDHSRVKLSHDERDETLGYINANYVDGYQKPNAYIATQGPMPNTFGDFWRMIWEKNCSIIVMITNVKEKGRIKCDQYWPDEGIEYYGNIQVTHLHTIGLAFYTKRIFTIKIKNSKKRCNTERLVYQYHFTDWPDHGVPYYIMPVLTFIKKSSRSNPEFGGPIVVHCSAGVGRTGTYIVIDAMMKQITHKTTVNIHTFLKHIRHQRNYLVQTEEQFIFIYDVLLESIKSGETDLTEHNYKSFINNLSRVLNEDGFKVIDRQFQLITEYKPKDYQISFAQMPYNMSKNRNQRIVPVNNSRVVLAKKPGIDGSEYINASYLHGASRQDEFIVTQYPTEDSKSNFWQMVWDNNSNQIVVLNADDTENCGTYWLPVGECMKCDSFTVMLREENFDMDFVIRDFLLQSIDEDYEFNCRMITACYWPDSCTPLKTTFDLINKVRLFRAQTIASPSLTQAANSAALSCLPPIIVHDLYGGFRAGTFCALYTFQDLIQMESCVNVYETAKMYHLKRPEIWSHRNNILFLYEAVETLFEEMHLNHQYQFKNFLNLNIDNHFNHLLNSNSFSQNASSNTGANNHMSLTLLPAAPNQSSINSQTVTLPNNFAKQNIPPASNQRNSLNDPIGTRLNSFQSQFQQQRVQSGTLADPTTTIPLTSNQLKSEQDLLNATSITTASVSNTPIPKTSLIDIPRILPFLSSYSAKNSSKANEGANKRVSAAAASRNNRAMKFMNTMMLKSASFKRALFPNSILQYSSGQKQQDPSEIVCQDVQNMEQKPSMIIALSSTSSSATTSSSSTSALSTTVGVVTATEPSLSAKSAFSPVPTGAVKLHVSNSNLNASVNLSPAKKTSLSNEKLA